MSYLLFFFFFTDHNTSESILGTGFFFIFFLLSFFLHVSLLNIYMKFNIELGFVLKIGYSTLLAHLYLVIRDLFGFISFIFLFALILVHFLFSLVLLFFPFLAPYRTGWIFFFPLLYSFCVLLIVTNKYLVCIFNKVSH